MRFLLKSSPSSFVDSKTHGLASRIRSAAPVSVSPTPAEATSHQNEVGGSKAWAQQCGSNCGCVLRFEAQLLECPSSTSPTIVQATYHAKRVMATASTSGRGNDGIHLKPLTNQRSQPMLTSCTCPTLHHMAKQSVEHLNGKTLAQIRNEMNMGVVGTRSSVAHRHTVLRESVLPTIEGTRPTNFRIAKKESTKQSTNWYDTTQQHFHCYDLVEGSLLSMIHERMPNPRNDCNAESYSPTLGEYYRMYSSSGRKQATNVIGDGHQVENESEMENQFAFTQASDWHRRSPSSYFLFGDEFNGSNTSSMTRIFIQHVKDSISDRLFGGNEIKQDKTGDHRPTTSYLKLLDMYGVDNNRQDEDTTVDDWLDFVDRNYHQKDLA